MSIIRSKDFVAGLLFVGFGISALVITDGYPMGSAASMGPGYFPRLLGGLLVLLGAGIALRSVRAAAAPPVAFGRPLAAAVVLGAIALFGLGVERLGLLLIGFLVVAIASLASIGFRPKEALASAVVLAAASVAGFVYGLGLPLTALPSWFD